jgi:hypothetical protein
MSNHIKLTSCCNAHSTFDENGELYCKRCYEVVPIGEGDGSVEIKDPWVILCEVWGGVTGSRKAFYKYHDTIVVYEGKEAAEEHAKQLDITVNSNPNRCANFRYTAEAAEDI